MIVDYGTIHVKFHPNLTYDQKMSILIMNIENQLHTDNRVHKNIITNHCITLLKMMDDGVPFNFVCDGIFYKYAFAVSYENIFPCRCK